MWVNMNPTLYSASRAMMVELAASPMRREPLHKDDRAVIVGAGPGGLSAAYLLAKEGTGVTVLEASDDVGGLARTVQYKGYRFDVGGHRFFTKYPPVQELWDELLGQDLMRVPRLSRIYYKGRYFDYPLKAGNALHGLGLGNATLIVLSYLRARLWPSRNEENFEQWVTNRFGRRLYEIFFKTYTEKVWGVPCTEIRAEWAAQRIHNLSLVKAVLSATPMIRRPADIKTLITEFHYPRLGPGQMWDTCRDRICDLGGRILTRHHVKQLVITDNRVTGVRAKTSANDVFIEGEHFVSTMPLRDLVAALSPPAPERVQKAGKGLRYRDFIVVALILEHADVFPDNWIYIHSSGVKVGRIQNFNNWSRAMVPEEGRTCLGLEYFCFEGDDLWTSSDDEMIALGRNELGQLGLADPALVVDGVVVRVPKAYPIYDANYREHLEIIQEYLNRVTNLHPVGRNGMHKYNNQDHSMLTAMMSVWKMMGADHDVWAVNSDFEYHEEMRIR